MARWLEALDYASQALAADPSQAAAAALVGTARKRLGTISKASAELRQITVVAVDMYRSTAIAAQVGPESMRELMLEVYEVCIDAVARYEGRVTKYLGDGILALFGYPVAHEDDARRAVLASLAVLEGVDARAAEWEARFGTPVAVQDRGRQRRGGCRSPRRQPMVDRGDRRRPAQCRVARAGDGGPDDRTGHRRDQRADPGLVRNPGGRSGRAPQLSGTGLPASRAGARRRPRRASRPVRAQGHRCSVATPSSAVFGRCGAGSLRAGSGSW